MQVIVLSKSKFDSTMNHLGLYNHNVEGRQQTFFISINGTEQTDERPHFDDKENVKVIYFDDVEQDLPKAKAFTIEQARELVDFIEKHKHRQRVIVHCAAGISRSGAVGSFISDFYGGDASEFKRRNPQVIPNGLVLRLLKQVLYERNAEI